MATFLYEKAKKFQAVYIRRVLAGGAEKYERKPFNLIEYDDNSGMYIEPVPAFGVGFTDPKTWYDLNTAAQEPDIFILDREPFREVTEIR